MQEILGVVTRVRWWGYLIERSKLLATFANIVSDAFASIDDEFSWSGEDPWGKMQAGLNFPGFVVKGNIENLLAAKLMLNSCKISDSGDTQTREQFKKIFTQFALENPNMTCAKEETRICMKDLLNLAKGKKPVSLTPSAASVLLVRLGCLDKAAVAIEGEASPVEKQWIAQFMNETGKKWNRVVGFTFETLKELSSGARPNWEMLAQKN